MNESTTWHFRHIDGSVFAQPLRPVVQTNSYTLLRDLAQRGMGIVRISETMIRRELAEGKLVRALAKFRCVDPAGDDYSVRLVYPDRHLPFRVRLFAQHLLQQLNGPRANAEEIVQLAAS